MKKLIYFFTLLIAGLTACSCDYDDPPEQPDSHQQEEPVVDSLGTGTGTGTSQGNNPLCGKWYLFRQDGYDYYLERIELSEDGTFVIKTNGYVHSNSPRTEKCTYRIAEDFKYDEEMHMDKATIYVYHRKISYNSHNENDSTRCDFYLKGDTLMFRYYETSDSYFFNFLVNAGSKPEKWYVRDTKADNTYTTISPIKVSSEVEAFFNEALPTFCDTAVIGDWVNYIGDFQFLEPVELMGYSIISDQETFEAKYVGNKTLPQIDFNKYSFVFGRYLLGIDETINYIDIQPVNNDYYIVLHTTDPSFNNYQVSYSTDGPHWYYSGIEGRLKSFWGIFPKDLPDIWCVYSEKKCDGRKEPVEASSTIKAFFEANLYTSFFNDKEKGRDTCLVVNSQKELAAIYSGTDALPDIDYNTQTLVIGKTLRPTGEYVVKYQVILKVDGKNFLFIKIGDSSGSTTFWDMYYWGLYPKFEEHIDRVMISQE